MSLQRLQAARHHNERVRAYASALLVIVALAVVVSRFI